jgi:hypothetical protein
MERAVRQARRWRAVVTACLAALANPAWGENVSVEELRRELATMKQQMQKMQEKIDRQEEMIQKLGGAPPPVPPPVAATPPPPEPPVAAAPGRWSPAQPITLLGSGRSYLNLSFDALVDAGWSTNPDVPQLELGDHDPIQRGFTLPNAEIALDGAVDPYFRGAANLVFKLDENNETEVELEEVYLMTTSLPWNLQAKAGQFLSEFGRQNQQHPHAWDFVDIPLVLGRLLGPEGLRNPGARMSWLMPTPFYAELLLGVQNSQGETAFSFRNADDELFGRPPVDRSVRGLGDLLYVPRAVASFDLTDSQTIVAGVSGALGPNSSGLHDYTQIVGGDVYWKWKPPWQSGGFPFVAVQSEALGRRYEAAAAGTLPHETLYDWGVYGQVLYGFTQRWVAGLRGEWVSGDRGAFAPDENRADRARMSPNLTFYPTEFSKIRLQYNFDHGQLLGADSSVWVQLEFLLGAHAAHKF